MFWLFVLFVFLLKEMYPVKTTMAVLQSYVKLAIL